MAQRFLRKASHNNFGLTVFVSYFLQCSLIFLLQQLKSDNFLKDSFFPAVIAEWNNLDININSSSIIVFKKDLLTFTGPEPNLTILMFMILND